MAFSAGEVFVRLGALFEDRDFNKYDRAIAKARAHRDVKTELKADYDGRGFALFERSVKGAENRILSLGTRLPLLKFGAIGVAAVAAANGIIQLTAALGPLTGALVALPAAVTVAAQGIGSLLLATRGVGDALKAGIEQAYQSGRDAQAIAKQQQSSAESLRSSSRSLTDAKRQEKIAEEDLTEARKEARRELQDLRLEAEGAALGETRATQTLKEARRDLLGTIADPSSTTLDIESAQTRVAEAELGVRQARLDSKRTSEDLAEAERKHVRGSDRMVNARRNLEQAERSVADASRALEMAEKDAAEGMRIGSTAASKYQQELAKLPPAAQHFVKYLLTLRPEIRNLRNEAAQGLFPGLEQGIRSANRNFPVLQRVVRRTNEEFGSLAERAGRMFGSSGWGRDLETIGNRNVTTLDRMGRSTLYLMDALRHLLIASKPVQDYITRGALLWSKHADAEAKAGRESGRLEDYFRRVVVVMRVTGDIGENLWRTIKAIGQASNDSATGGNNFLQTLRATTRGWREFTESARGQERLGRIFDSIHRSTTDVFHAIGDLIDRFNELRMEGKSSLDALVITLSEVFSRALEKTAETVGKYGPRIAWAFVKGFMGADAWGKLAIGAWLITKFGGWGGLFRRMGVGAGAAMAEGTVAGAAGGGLIGGLRARFSRLSPALKAIGIGAGVIIGSGIVNALGNERGLGDQIEDVMGSVVPGLRNADERFKVIIDRINEFKDTLNFKDVTGEWEDFSDEQRKAMVQAVEAHNRLIRSFRYMRINGSRDLEGLRRSARSNMEDISFLFAHDPPEMAKQADRSFGLVADSIADAMRSGRLNTRDGMRFIREQVRVHSMGSKEAAARQFGLMRDAIAETMRRGGRITARGMELIRKLVVQELQLYGLDPKEALKGGKNWDRSFKQTPELKQLGDLRERGGLHVFGRMGDRGTDQIPALIGGQRVRVGSGEVAAVMTGHQQGIVNYALTRLGIPGLPGLFSKFNKRHSVPFERGGSIVGIPGEPGESIDRRILPDVMAIRRRYRGDITDGYAPTGHAAGGEHPLGLAIDMIPGARGSWGLIDALARWAEPSQNNPRDPFRWVGYQGDANHGRGNHIHLSWQHGPGFPAAWVKTLGGKIRGAMSTALPHLRIGGRPSGMHSVLQGGLDTVRRGANRGLNRILGSSVGGAEGMEGVQEYHGALDRVFPRHSLADAAGHVQLSRRQVHRLHSQAGLPGIFDDISWRESKNYPGVMGFDPGGTIGEGLHQITFGVQSEATQRILRGIGNSFNPWRNTLMARWMYKQSGLSPWNASGPYERGGVIEAARGALFGGGGTSPSFGFGGAGPTAAGMNEALGLPPVLGVTDKVGGSIDPGGSKFKQVVDNASSMVSRIAKQFPGYRSGIERIDSDYSLKERFFDLSEETIVLQKGDPGWSSTNALRYAGSAEAPYIDPTALERRSRELKELTRLRRRQFDYYKKYVSGIERIVRIYRGARDRLRDMLPKMPKKQQPKYRKQIEKFGNLIRGERGLLRSVRGSRAEAYLTWREIRGELNEIAPGAQEELASMVGDGGGGGSESDTSAALSQAQTQIANLQNAYRLAQGFITTITGPGDIGSGYVNPQQAAAYPYSGAPPVSGGGAAGGVAGAASREGPAVYQTNYMLMPDDPEVLRKVGQAAVGGIAMQGYIPSSREKLGL